MVHRTDNDGLVVNWVDVEREEGALDPQHVPTGKLVAAGHRVETLPADYPVPRLHLRRSDDVIMT